MVSYLIYVLLHTEPRVGKGPFQQEGGGVLFRKTKATADLRGTEKGTGGRREGEMVMR